jgi:hypothetical protein
MLVLAEYVLQLTRIVNGTWSSWDDGVGVESELSSNDCVDRVLGLQKTTVHINSINRYAHFIPVTFVSRMEIGFLCLRQRDHSCDYCLVLYKNSPAMVVRTDC